MNEFKRLTGNYVPMEISRMDIGVRTTESIEILKFPIFDETDLVNHCFSTRIGGCSEGIYESMNLGFNLGDSDENVVENHRRIAEILDVKIENIVRPFEQHTANVAVFDEELLLQEYIPGVPRRPFDYDEEGIDGIVTNLPGVAISVFASDCVPVFFLDPVKKAIGICHSGWKGTVKRIGRETVAKMKEAFGSNPKDIICAIGPCICKDCYEISEDVALKFIEEFSSNKDLILEDKGNGKYQLDLKLTNRIVLEEAGVKKEKISVGDICTCCNHYKLFSHRATNGKRGNNGGFIVLK